MGMMSEHRDFWHVSNVNRDLERDRTRAFFLPVGAWSPISAFKRVCDEYCFLSQKTPKLGRNGSVTHLWIHFVLEEDQLLQVANGCGLQSTFDTTSDLHTFWIKVKAEYPETATGALKSLLPFPTSYLRQVGFSSVAATDFGWQCLPSFPDRTI